MKVKPEELISRFRSKEDLYKYLTLQGNGLGKFSFFDLVNVFLPSIHVTKLGFMRDILSEAKKFLRQNEVNDIEVPCYQEISVKICMKMR
jgi:hypothetical protein